MSFLKKILPKRTTTEASFSDKWKSEAAPKHRPWVLMLLFALFPTAAVLHRPALRAYGNWLSTSDFSEVADVAVVIDTKKARVEAAVQLLEQGRVNSIFINSTSKQNFNNLLEQYNLSEGQQAFWGGCRSTTTYAQPYYFLQAYDYYEIGDLESIVIITDKYHLRRSRWSYRHVLHGKGIYPQIHTYASPDKAIRKNLDWWQYDHAKSWVHQETQKYLFYLVNYGLLNQENEDITSSNLFKEPDPKELAEYLARKEAQCGELDPSDPLDQVPLQKL